LRNLKNEQSQIDRSKGKLTLGELCDRSLQTFQHQRPKTVEGKTLIVRRIKEDWPTGKQTQIGKVNLRHGSMAVAVQVRRRIAKRARARTRKLLLNASFCGD
jgi:hypothetical protein